MATITLDRERTLSYTWPGIKRLHREQGINFLAMIADEEDWYLDPVKFSAVLWAGLIGDDPELSIEAVDAMIALPQLPAITKAMLAAVGEAVADAAPDPPIPSAS